MARSCLPLDFFSLDCGLVNHGELSGIVLGVDPSGERFHRLRIFDGNLGLTSAMLRLPARSSKSFVRPDLFDDLECSLSVSRSGASLPFVSEHRLLGTFREIAKNPMAFLAASEVARFYLSNGSHLLDPKGRLSLLRSALDSFRRATSPKVVLLKVYFCFARDEGHPIRESWLADLPADLARQSRQCLFHPVDGAGSCSARIDELLDEIRKWINMHTELRAA